MINRLLVANRGEIARRVFATCRRLGIETVAVHSDADVGLPFVREADAAVRLPGTSPTETYLDAALVLEAARRTGADAIHPGYGFLSENAAFARAVLDAGLTWVGPAPESIEQMGSKVESKKLMEAAGVPVLGNLTPDTATEADLPLLVKASAGGGGRGMRVVRALADLPDEIDRAAAEAESAFGDGTVFVEPYVERGRHVEVQVVGDGEGQVLVLGERDCSLQRRHQKVVEESPAPELSAETAHALHEAARKAGEAIRYRGAGTVEFLYDPQTGRFWFLEMNTRLQVEHPVTELVHGVDLVEMQIQVAEGAGVPELASLAARAPGGHAIEVRLYAEDPARDWQPQSGTLTAFDVPGVSVEFAVLDRAGLGRAGLRLDAGFEAGSEVSTHYDAMLAKVIAWAPTRTQAARRLAGALAGARLHGPATNRDLLVSVLRDPAFLAGRVSTSFLVDRTFDQPGEGPSRAAATAAALALAERSRASRTVQRGIPVAWRNVLSQPQRIELEAPDGSRSTVEWLGGRDGYAVDDFVVVAVTADSVTLEADGVRTTYDVAVAGDAVDVDSPRGHVRLTRVPRFTDPADAVASGSLLAPMPGTVVTVAVEAGAHVEAGQPVLVLEAMKMQHTVSAPHAGVVTEIDVKPGDQVAAGEVMAVVSTGSTTEDSSTTRDSSTTEGGSTTDESEEA
ncbi:biotin carboxylase N-terminal domain-containing protein [Nocardioides koreensis]|uniref:Biotin carboxylase N-terminal domain-containing protein n=1 Tax=Nocardioides koreensis TaxID=433651 RepID=A0ABN2ZXU8_9ACTN